jgi:hypothetical protein
METAMLPDNVIPLERLKIYNLDLYALPEELLLLCLLLLTAGIMKTVIAETALQHNITSHAMEQEHAQYRLT